MLRLIFQSREYEIEVIGNVFENTEFLGEGKVREIKFRVWNPELKEMYILSKKEYLGGTGIYDDLVGHEKGIWMQYTGLKDQNGREIYEGDILELANGEGALRSVVEYHAPSFCHRWLNLKEAKLRGINVEPLLWNTHIIFKVIGNIYEHPHLLEVKGNE